LNKFDSIIKQSREIKDFKTYDIDSEWSHFSEVLEKETSSLRTEKSTKKTPIIYKYISAIAALLLLVLAFLFVLRPEPKTRESFTALYRDSLVQLVDGSTINVLKTSSISYPVTLSKIRERKITLKGNGDFRVSKSILPFKIYFDDFLIEVLGTTFRLRNLDSIYTFNVTEGKVSVIHLPTKQSLILQKGDDYSFKNGAFTDLNKQKETFLKNLEEINFDNNKSTLKKDLLSQDNKGSVYKLDSVLKKYLKKFYKKRIKIDRKFKYAKDQRVKLDLNKPLIDILNALQNQGVISFKTGKCHGCYIITSPARK
jgi:hypothetical protein